MILYIDTTDNDVAELVLIVDKKTIKETFASLPHAEDFTATIKRFLRKHKTELAAVKKLAVKVGPGFFSRVRTGVVAANGLAFGLRIPIVAVRGKVNYKQIIKARGEGMVKPFYGGQPHITKPKKRKSRA